MDHQEAIYRDHLLPTDPDKVGAIVKSSGFFSAQEIDVAVELIRERETKGPASGYFFLFADIDDDLKGYACFGPVPCTKESFDIYWIAVSESMRGHGLGKKLLRKTEDRIKNMGGNRIYVETSSKALYEPTRAFYKRCGYEVAAVLEHFYSPDDHKIIFLKVLP